MIYINKNLFSQVKVLTTSHHVALKTETKHPIQTYSQRSEQTLPM